MAGASKAPTVAVGWLPGFDAQGLNVALRRADRLYLFVGTRWITVAIWILLASIFVLDVVTHPENVTACFAYAIPILLSLFEQRPRPLLYAGTATFLSFVGSFGQPSSDMPNVAILANRLIAIATQWLVALLVRVQYRRHLDMQREAEFQRRFVDILSHEIGTALTTISGQAYRLTKLAGQLAPGDLTVRAEKIRSAAERIEAVVDRVQFASSLGDGSIPIGHSAVDMSAMMRRLVEQFREEQPGRPIELSAPQTPQVVRGDETLLRQAFENVIVNSAKYSTQDASITVDVSVHGSSIRVRIADRGNGIAKDDLSRVREPYYRGQSSKGTSGAGLGLYFVERIVEAHDGTIQIESAIGRGTEVTIDLPQSTDAPCHE